MFSYNVKYIGFVDTDNDHTNRHALCFVNNLDHVFFMSEGILHVANIEAKPHFCYKFVSKVKFPYFPVLVLSKDLVDFAEIGQGSQYQLPFDIDSLFRRALATKVANIFLKEVDDNAL